MLELDTQCPYNMAIGANNATKTAISGRILTELDTSSLLLNDLPFSGAPAVGAGAAGAVVQLGSWWSIGDVGVSVGTASAPEVVDEE